jgi:hypothetical protein
LRHNTKILAPMTTVNLLQKLSVLLAFAVCAAAPGSLGAQESSPAPDAKPNTKSEVSAPADSSLKIPVERNGEHRFWDPTNDWLFAGVAASRTLDYFSTLNMRRRGDHEILLTNDVVDNHPAFAVIEAAGTATSIGVSYLFHRYNHHKLERWTSIVHIGLTTGGAVRNYCLKTVHTAPASSP